MWPDFYAEGHAPSSCARALHQALQESRAIAVPGSFNDQFADADIRNYAGNVWYQREVFIPKGWAGQRIVLRFDAVTHYGKVWVNNQE